MVIKFILPPSHSGELELIAGTPGLFFIKMFANAEFEEHPFEDIVKV
ncbi:MAG: hypothetical protein NVSMB45_08480 [Ginsengibacter sp.]